MLTSAQVFKRWPFTIEMDSYRERTERPSFIGSGIPLRFEYLFQLALKVFFSGIISL